MPRGREQVTLDRLPLLTVEDLDRLFRIRPRTVRKWKAEGKLEALDYGRSDVFTTESVAEAVFDIGYDIVWREPDDLRLVLAKVALRDPDLAREIMNAGGAA